MSLDFKTTTGYVYREILQRMLCLLFGRLMNMTNRFIESIVLLTELSNQKVKIIHLGPETLNELDQTEECVYEP